MLLGDFRPKLEVVPGGGRGAEAYEWTQVASMLELRVTGDVMKEARVWRAREVGWHAVGEFVLFDP